MMTYSCRFLQPCNAIAFIALNMYCLSQLGQKNQQCHPIEVNCQFSFQIINFCSQFEADMDPNFTVLNNIQTLGLGIDGTEHYPSPSQANYTQGMQSAQRQERSLDLSFNFGSAFTAVSPQLSASSQDHDSYYNSHFNAKEVWMLYKLGATCS